MVWINRPKKLCQISGFFVLTVFLIIGLSSRSGQSWNNMECTGTDYCPDPYRPGECLSGPTPCGAGNYHKNLYGPDYPTYPICEPSPDHICYNTETYRCLQHLAYTDDACFYELAVDCYTTAQGCKESVPGSIP